MKIIACVFGIFLLISCDASKLSPTPDSKFIGVWELHGRDMLEGIHVSIVRNQSGDLEGRVVKLNDNKYVRLFLDSNSVFIPKISRNSNFEFALSENKVGREIFGTYGLETQAQFSVQFLNNNIIVLSDKANDSSIKKSKIQYVRVAK